MLPVPPELPPSLLRIELKTEPALLIPVLALVAAIDHIIDIDCIALLIDAAPWAPSIIIDEMVGTLNRHTTFAKVIASPIG